LKIIRINGETRHTEIETLDRLVGSIHESRSGLVLEYNGRIIKESEWADIQLADEDVIEMLRFVGGG